jgi:DNA repair protein RadA/Sms
VTEVQALVAPPTAGGNPRRTVGGLDTSRVAMVVAVLDRRCRVAIAHQDIYVATVGGVRLTEPASDLAVALALCSAGTDLALPPTTVAFGEVGLAGEVRPVPGLQRRLSEASRLGFTTAVVPVGALEQASGLEGVTVHEVTSLSQAVSLVLATAVPGQAPA